jgi:hypothetical protein
MVDSAEWQTPPNADHSIQHSESDWIGRTPQCAPVLDPTKQCKNKSYVHANTGNGKWSSWWIEVVDNERIRTSNTNTVELIDHKTIRIQIGKTTVFIWFIKQMGIHSLTGSLHTKHCKFKSSNNIQKTVGMVLIRR